MFLLPIEIIKKKKFSGQIFSRIKKKITPNQTNPLKGTNMQLGNWETKHCHGHQKLVASENEEQKREMEEMNDRKRIDESATLEEKRRKRFFFFFANPITRTDLSVKAGKNANY